MLRLVESMVLQTVGRGGQDFLGLIFSRFSFILFINLRGLIPYSFSVSAHLAITLSLTLIV